MADLLPVGNVIEAEEHAEDTDSAYGDELSSYTNSLTSSALNYKWEHGRRYHGFREGTYNFPNDEREQDRYDIMHAVLVTAMGDKHFLAPLSPNTSRILDIGTGTGIWAIEVGDMFPSAEVIGNDFSPIQPQWVPPNVIFEVDDVESEWEYSRPFSFIHSRYMAGSIADWPRLMHQCYKHLEPGGWVEFQDFDLRNYSQDDSIPPGNKLLELYNNIIEACEKIGRTGCPGPNFEAWVEEAGFVNVHHETFKLPVGPWPKDERLKRVGAFNLVQLREGLEAFSLALFTKALGWSVEDVQVFLTEVRRDILKKSVHMMHEFHVVYAQKPET